MPGEVTARELLVKQITRNTNIPSQFVNHIEQLDNGFMLISTTTGVRIFDGRKFVNLLGEEGFSLSPLNSNVYSTLEDSNGDIWLATASGLYRLQHQTKQLLKIETDEKNESAIGNDNVREIMQDHAGNLWFGTLDGVSMYNISNGQFENFQFSEPNTNNENALGRIYVLFQESKSLLWIGSSNGLFSLNLETKLIQRSQSKAGHAYITSAFKPNATEIWFGADSAGIFKYDLTTRQFRLHNTQTPNEFPLKSNNIWALYQDNSGKIWIGYWSKGVTVYDPSERKVFKIEYRPYDQNTLPSNSIEMFTSDTSGLVWIATTNGAVIFNPATYVFDYLISNPDDKNSIAETAVLSVVEDHQGDVWIGHEKGLEKWNPITQEVTHYYHNSKDPFSITEGAIWQIRNVNQDHLLLATDKGIDLFNKRTAKAQHYDNLQSKSGEVLKMAFYAMEKSASGDFYVASSSSTIHKLDPLTGEANLVFDATENSLTAEAEYFSVILPVDNNQLWFGSTTGLYLLDMKSKKITRFSVADKQHALSSNIIYDLYQDLDKNIWVATATGGINKITPQISNNGNTTFQVKYFTQQQGLPSHEILNLIPYRDNKLWFNTRHALGFIDTISEKIKTFSVLYQDEKSFTEGSSYYSDTGSVYLGGDGLFKFNINDLEQSSFSPPVVITEISKLYKNHVDFSPLFSEQKIQFFPQDSLVSFSFSSLDYASPEKNQYRYKLVNYDTKWLSPGTNNSATYTNLPAGDYQLVVQATNRDGIWSDQAANLGIIVHPPLWRTWYAKLAYLLCILLAVGYVIYIRQQKRIKELATMRAIRDSEHRLRDVLWGSGDVLWRWDMQKQEVEFTNNLSLDNIPQQETVPFKLVFENTHPEDREQVNDMIDRHIKGNEDHYEAQFRIFDNESNDWRWVLSRGRIVETDDNGEPLILAGTRKDIDDLKKTEKQLRYLANYDQLTQLPNRSLFHEHLNHSIRLAHRFNEQVALLFFDLDGFKLINDSMGHAVGDQLLQAVALRMLKVLRNTDNCARLGGDEFAVIVERISSKDEVKPTIERLQTELSRPFMLNDQSVVTSVSIGAAFFPQDGDKPAEILKHADIAMYEAKREGKKNYRFYEPRMNALLVKRLDMEHELDVAIEENQFVTYFQPRVSVADNQIKGFEALIRWIHPEKGLISPAEFIPIAEDTGQILELGNWILRDACRQAAIWYKAGWRGFVSVNIAALQFQQSDLVSCVESALKNSMLDPACLELEITEGTLIKNIERTGNIILRLKNIGVRIALDDFGTGYSSLSYLQQLPIDALKIDRAFISQLTTSQKSARLCNAIINMAHSLELTVVAEGIEDDEQLTFLKRANCEEYQGFLFGKPTPVSEIDIAKHSK